MDRVAQRVAFRWLVAGILQAPPKMVSAITKWAENTFWAEDLEKTRGALRKEVEWVQEQTERFDQIEDLLKVYLAKPYSYKAFKPIGDRLPYLSQLSGRWMHGIPKGLARRFQKLTDEKRAWLDDFSKQVEQDALKGIAVERRRLHHRKKQLEDQIVGLKSGMHSGVAPSKLKNGVATKRFPVDLEGWRYWTPEVRDALYARVRESAEGMANWAEKRLDRTKDDEAEAEMLRESIKKFRSQVENPGRDYDSIQVILKRQIPTSKGGSWKALSRELEIIQHDVDGLHSIVRHELQHFAQSYITYMVAEIPDMADVMDEIGGFPSSRIRTPHYKQELSPGHPAFDPENPAIQKLLRRLRELGLSASHTDFHALDDVEFYTRLADEIEKFNQAWRKSGGRGDKKVAIRIWTGTLRKPGRLDPKTEELGGFKFLYPFEPRPYFTALLRRARPKWKKAVGEFVKAVM